MAAATKAVQQRRRPALATLETANAVAGVYAWVGGPLKAGARCILAYNCRCAACLWLHGCCVGVDVSSCVVLVWCAVCLTL
jgi:hypothetical protein